MPLVRVEIYKGKTKEYKKMLLDSIHNALVEAFHVPEDDRLQRLYEIEQENFIVDKNKTEQFTLVELTIFKGRSIEAKRKLYASIVSNLKTSLAINENDVMIVIHEPPLENWGLSGGKAAIDIDLGFNIEV